MCVGVQVVRVCTVHMWRPKDSLSFYCVDFGDQTQVISIHGKHFDPLSCLVGPVGTSYGSVQATLLWEVWNPVSSLCKSWKPKPIAFPHTLHWRTHHLPAIKPESSTPNLSRRLLRSSPLNTHRPGVSNIPEIPQANFPKSGIPGLSRPSQPAPCIYAPFADDLLFVSLFKDHQEVLSPLALCGLAPFPG